MEKRWFVKELPETKPVNFLKKTLGVPNVIAAMLVKRGVQNFEDAKTFFRPSLDELHNPFLMKGMEEAVHRINQALGDGERILIYGDYDVDGTTSVAMMVAVLKKYTSNIDFYIPDRYSEGYGVSFQSIDFAEENKFSLIISLDCGIKAIDQVKYAQEKNIDFIICDHHLPGKELPEAIILNPKQVGCTYPYKELSGCGVGFKLLCGLAEKNAWDSQAIFDQLDLVATSIGADLVHMTGENRVLCFHGLKRINSYKRPGFEALLKFANHSQLKELDITNIVFIIAPRINAAGRLETGNHAVELLLTQSIEEALPIAEKINAWNLQRREFDTDITAEALEILTAEEGYSSKTSTVVFKEDWHKGVVGIVASRIKEVYYRPTIVLTESNGEYTGSARSVDNFDVNEAIESCADLLTKFGGHQMAAGLSMLPANLPAFKTRFETYVSENIRASEKIEQIDLELELKLEELFEAGENLADIPKIKRLLAQFEPHGPMNMKPIFISKNVFARQVQLLKGEHLKMEVFQKEDGISLPCIGFRMPEKQEIVIDSKPFDIAYTLEVNEWVKNSGEVSKTLQLVIKDIRAIF